MLHLPTARFQSALCRSSLLFLALSLPALLLPSIIAAQDAAQLELLGMDPGILGKWVVQGGDYSVLELAPHGKLTLGDRQGTWRASRGKLLIVMADNQKLQMLKFERGEDWMRLEGKTELGGLLLRRPASAQAESKATPIPDASVFSPDSPRYVTPGGRASIIKPTGFEIDYFDRSGLGEIVLRNPEHTQLFVRFWIVQVPVGRGFYQMEKLLKWRLENLPGEVDPVRPVGGPEFGTLWRWPARSTRIETVDGKRSGWTSIVRAESWAVHFFILGPRAESDRMVRFGRRLFHDVRLRPNPQERLKELQLKGNWVVTSDGKSFQVGDKLWFGGRGDYRWWKASEGWKTSEDGTFLVRGSTLLMHHEDQEKEMELQVPPAGSGEDWLIISGQDLAATEESPSP